MATIHEGRLNLEESLIARLAITPEDAIACDMAVEEFFFGHTQEIYRVLKDFCAAGESWDLVLLSHKLTERSSSKLNEITRDPDLIAHAMAPYVAEIRLCRMQSIVPEAIHSVGTSDPLAVISAIQGMTEKMHNRRPAESLAKIASELYTKFETTAQNPGQLTGIPTGLRALDDITWGLQPRRVYILAARPSMGKSALAINIALQAALAGFRVYIQSLEESKHAVASRLMSRLSFVPNEKLQRGQIDDADWVRLVKTVDSISQLPIIVDDSTGLSSAEISQRVRVENTAKPIHLLIVDHLQEVADEAPSRHLAISKAASTLRGLAKSLGIPVIILSQLSRNVESRTDKKPLMSDLKESGDIEAIADVVMLLFRASYYTKDRPPNDTMEISFAKNRDGRTGTVELGFRPRTMTVCDWDDTFTRVLEGLNAG